MNLRDAHYHSTFYLTCRCVCEPGYFQCPGDQCIPVDRLCDGHKDCPSGTDEAICAIKGNKYSYILYFLYFPPTNM